MEPKTLSEIQQYLELSSDLFYAVRLGNTQVLPQVVEYLERVLSDIKELNEKV